MSSAPNTHAFPLRAIIMMLVSLAILFAVLAVHGFLTRNDDPAAALNAQEELLNAAASNAPAAATAPASDEPAICVIAVGDVNVSEAIELLGAAGLAPQSQPQFWAGEAEPPANTTVYFEGTATADADRVSAALPGSDVAARPDGLTACADSIAVAVAQ